MLDPAVLSAAATAAVGVLTTGGVALHARSKSTPAPETVAAPDLVAALEAIRDEPVPVLATHDLTNVHIPGSYATRVQQLAVNALEAHDG